MGNWGEIPYDIIALIAKHVKVMEDFIALGAVCTSWQAGATKENFDTRSPQVPFLMLADTGDDYREFYSLSKKRVVRRVFLPEVKGRECIPAEGWLCTVSSDLGEMDLFHPFSRARIQLPPLASLLSQHDFRWDPHFEEEAKEPYKIEYHNISCALLSANPSLTSDYALVVSVSVNHFCPCAFWRPGDVNWNYIESMYGVTNMIYYKGRFYLTDYDNQVWTFDIPAGASSVRHILDEDVIEPVQYDIFLEGVMRYLVEVSGALLIVCQFHSDALMLKTIGFKVYELDITSGGLEEINTLGDSAVFLGLGAAHLVDSSRFIGVKPNHIYFTDSRYSAKRYITSEGGAGRDMGAYNLEDGKFESFYPGLSISPISPPTWVTPSLL